LLDFPRPLHSMCQFSATINGHSEGAVTAQDYWRYFFPLEFGGVACLLIGLIRIRHRLSFSSDGLLPLGVAFVPLALAVFGAEHFTSAKNLLQMVPSWIPARLFWVYFVGFALIAAALSIAFEKYVRWSSALLGLLFLLFVVCIHIPGALAQRSNRFGWTVVARETLFALGAWALTGTVIRAPRLVGICRAGIALVLVFFAVEHFLHPQFLPGVPLSQQTPPWIPFRSVWGFVEGTALLTGGVLILINRHARAAAAWLGVVTTVMVIALYVPLFVVARKPMEVITAINYIADTLLFAGSVMFLAGAVPASKTCVPISTEC
jgi:uncharacterized membrane protein